MSWLLLILIVSMHGSTMKYTLHVSDGLSVHHQEFKTVRTATGINQTDTASRNEMEHLVPAGKQVAVSV